MQSSQCTDHAPFIRVSLLAYGLEISPAAPIESHLAQLLLDTIYVVFLNYIKITSSIVILHSLNMENMCLALEINSSSFWRRRGSLVLALSVLDFS